MLNPNRSSDWLVCSWFLQRREKCQRWWIIEWDVYCSMPAQEYYRRVWDLPLVASSVRLRYREPEWRWFSVTKDFPEQYRPFAMGAVPFLFLVSDRALQGICKALIKAPPQAGNGEMRFCTAANWCGFPACGFSPPHDYISWVMWKTLPQERGIFHPVKHLVTEVQAGAVTQKRIKAKA
jgi:hypothetical protein